MTCIQLRSIGCTFMFGVDGRVYAMWNAKLSQDPSLGKQPRTRKRGLNRVLVDFSIANNNLCEFGVVGQFSQFYFCLWLSELSTLCYEQRVLRLKDIYTFI